MSLEQEMAEISTLYHGQRARMEELVQLIKDGSGLMDRYYELIKKYNRLIPGREMIEIEEWQQRAQELTGGPNEPGK